MRSWLLMFLIACGGGSKPAPQPPIAPVKPEPAKPATPVTPTAPTPAAVNRDDCKDIPCVIAALDDFSKQMCACKDKSCADKTNEVLTKWGTQLAEKPELADAKPSPDDAKKMGDVMQKYTDCMTKIMMADQGQPNNGGLGGGIP